MPLPFLADDARHDERQGAAFRRPGADEPWQRPYRPGPCRVAGAAVLLVFAAYLLFAALIDAAAGSVSGAGAVLVVAVLLVAWALRSLRVGIWLSGRGLRRTGLFRTTTIPWRRIGRVRTAQQPVKWLGLPRTVQGQALVIERSEGGELPVLLTDHSPDFLGLAEGFDVAADAIEGWAHELRR